jgi:DNA adenine methylase
MGSACLFFALRPRRAVLSDTNAELVNLYHEVVRDAGALAAGIAELPRCRATYDKLRRCDIERLPAAERAIRFLYLNRNAFNGLYRTNNAGVFNVPFSASRTGSMPTAEQLSAAAAALAGAEIECGDFEDVLTARARTGDFIYIDPPYAVTNRRIFRQYGPDTFGLLDLERLADLLIQLDALGCSFVVSYAECSEIRALTRSWHTRRVTTQRNISGFAAHRRRAVELLISNREPLRIS